MAERSTFAKIPAVMTKVNLVTTHMRNTTKYRLDHRKQPLKLMKKVPSPRREIKFEQHNYPVSVHARNGMAVPIEKLKT